MTVSEPAGRRRSRLWLYAPFVLLCLLAVGWSAFWFHARGRVQTAVDAGIAREAARGRNWSCGDRRIGGFPFRIELRCSGLALTSTRWGEAVRIETGPVVVLGQIYSPGLVIAEVSVPLRATLPEGRLLDLGWRSLQASLAHGYGRPERLSLVVAGPSGVLTTAGKTESWRAETLEAHLRSNPARPEAEQVADVALSAKAAILPALDLLLGTSDATDLELVGSVTQSGAFRLGFNPETLEAWRAAGGRFELTRLTTAKGPARSETSGVLALDAGHRVAGQLQSSVAGIEQIGGLRIGGLAAGLGGLFGNRQAQPAAPGLTPLPPISLRDGRVQLGPLRLPLPPLAPLY